MHVLSHLRLRTKLAILAGLSALAVIASITLAASILHQRLIDDRVDKLRAVVDTALGLARSLEDEVVAHQFSREQAIGQFRNAVHSIRFDGGVGYIFAQTLDNILVVHGANPELENKPSPATVTGGSPLTGIIREALRGANEGFVSYQFTKPGETRSQPKVAYVARFAPWDLVFVAGAYTDDLDATFRATLVDLATIGGVILLAALTVAWLVNRDIVASLGHLKSAMERLARGELTTEVTGTERRDEVGGMAGAVLVFKEQMIRAEELAAERDQERERAEDAKCAALLGMAETIETEAKQALGEIGRRTDMMAQAANDMSASAARTGASAGSAAGAAAQALATAQTVASAAEQLTASIREIGGQVNQSSAVVSRAVEAGRATRETIGALNEQVARIGTVADMISEIAARTNLLALNATIEAARAGDAGKGFAVVASEVKQLATQTAKSTEEIGRHIGEVRAATGASVAAVGRIEETIGEIDAIAGSIAAAVEQQGAATAEIARNVTETAAAANEMTGRTHEVSAEAEHTGQQAVEVRENTAALEVAMHDLHRTVLHLVRTATSEVDRRRYRRRACLVEATIGLRGKTEPGTVYDISERGCYAMAEARFPLGEQVEVAMSRFGIRIPATVVEHAGDGMHLTFVGDGVAADEADRISLASVAELMQKAREDHAGFVKRVVDIVASGEKLPPESLASSHHCRFGRWYDNVSDDRAMALPSFRALKQPHEAVHELGRKVLIALNADDATGAQRHVAAMRGQSDEVLRCLDALKRDYPTTFAKQAA
ncbi:MAG TPA: methyl-accepting chemotaxis protein [Acetobacteraceae bacterium]|jgi:methyl-accepting chemotaxis protein